jgi:hypothetical protein
MIADPAARRYPFAQHAGSSRISGALRAFTRTRTTIEKAVGLNTW